MKLTDADMESWNKWAEEEHDDYHNQHDRTLHQESVITNTRLQQTGNSKLLGTKYWLSLKYNSGKK